MTDQAAGLSPEEALAEATKVAARVARAGEDECVHKLAVELFNHATGYAAPLGKMLDGVWEPDPIQYLVGAHGVADTLAAELEKDRANEGTTFYAQRYCKSWRYCWWLAEAHFEGRDSLPGYVARAAAKFNFGKVRDEYATKAAKKAEKHVRTLAEKRHAESPAGIAEKEAAKRLEKIDAKLTQIEGLKKKIKRAEGKLKALRTRLKKAQTAAKRLAKKG